MKIEGVILAAGRSERAGAFKPALLVGGKTMLARCMEGMESVCERIIVVGGSEIDQLRPLLRGFDKAECVENRSFEEGMFTSVKTGLAAVQGDRCFILPGDVPLIPPVVYRQLLAVHADIVVPTYRGRNGHPVCLSKTVIPDILSHPDDSSLREIIRVIGYHPVPVNAEEILLDVDTPEDYASICRRMEQA